jgi:hypothetical protein
MKSRGSPVPGRSLCTALAELPTPPSEYLRKVINWKPTRLINCRCYLPSPALQSSSALAAQRHIDSQRRASCRCADSAVACTSLPQSFASWSRHESYRLLAVEAIIGSWPVVRNRLDSHAPVPSSDRSQ